MKQIKTYKQLAKHFLGVKGNWLRLYVAEILLVFAAMSPMVFASAVSYLVIGAAEEGSSLYQLGDWIFYGLWVLLGLTVTTLGIACFYRYAYLCYRRGRDGVGFCERQKLLPFGRSLLTGLLVLIRPLLVGALFVGAYAIGVASNFLLYLPAVVAAVWLALLIMWATGGLFLLPYYFSRGESLGRALKMSFRTMKGNYTRYGGYMMAFMGWILLSLITAGVLLLLYVMPVMLFTYFIMADRMDSALNAQEEYNR